MVGVVGSSPIAPTKYRKQNQSLQTRQPASQRAVLFLRFRAGTSKRDEWMARKNLLIPPCNFSPAMATPVPVEPKKQYQQCRELGASDTEDFIEVSSTSRSVTPDARLCRLPQAPTSPASLSKSSWKTVNHRTGDFREAEHRLPEMQHSEEVTCPQAGGIGEQVKSCRLWIFLNTFRFHCIYA